MRMLTARTRPRALAPDRVLASQMVPEEAAAACEALAAACAELRREERDEVRAEAQCHARQRQRARSSGVDGGDDADAVVVIVAPDEGEGSQAPQQAMRKKKGGAGFGTSEGAVADGAARRLRLRLMRSRQAEEPRRGDVAGSTDTSAAEVIVTAQHLEKLRTLYRLHQPSAAHPTPSAERQFLAAAFCALCRLHTLQGGHEGAGGMQGACPPEVFSTLRTDFGVAVEAFASPLNCRYPSFCSASLDVDAPFGSLGSFFRLRLTSGALLCNPPFDPACIAHMLRHIESCLAAANALAPSECVATGSGAVTSAGAGAGGATGGGGGGRSEGGGGSEGGGASLLFVVVIPTWPEQTCWRAIHASAHMAAHLRLPRSKHAYLDGGQHSARRAVPLRLSNHDSSVFFLASSACRANQSLFPLPFGKERRLREAFTGGLRVQGQLHK